MTDVAFPSRTCSCGERFVPKSKRQRFAPGHRTCQVADRNRKAPDTSSVHFMIPDTQVKAGVPNDHLAWINQYALDRYAGRLLKVVHIGDHWDMPSLSSYDRGKGKMEGRRYVSDIDAGNRGMELLTNGWDSAGEWTFDLTLGNHEERIDRAVNNDVQLEGLLSYDQLDVGPFKVNEFRKLVWLDGVAYAHYFYNANTGRPLSGENLETRLKTIGHSFVQGHQQGLKIGMRYVGGKQHIGIAAGSCYQHDEEYLGPQGNAHWRGVVILNNVEDGAADPMPVSLDYLCRRYEGHRLADHVGREL